MTIFNSKDRDYFIECSRGARMKRAWDQQALGMCYHNGKGVEPNRILAYKWFIISASNRIWDDPMRKKACKDEGAALMKKATPDELAEAQKLADEWIKENCT